MTALGWTVASLESDLPRLLAECRTDLERNTVRAFHGKEIREAADNQARQGRLSDRDQAIASKWGWQPRCGTT